MLVPHGCDGNGFDFGVIKEILVIRITIVHLVFRSQFLKPGWRSSTERSKLAMRQPCNHIRMIFAKPSQTDYTKFNLSHLAVSFRGNHPLMNKCRPSCVHHF